MFIGDLKRSGIEAQRKSVKRTHEGNRACEIVQRIEDPRSEFHTSMSFEKIDKV
jgi:hypothetical protein